MNLSRDLRSALLKAAIVVVLTVIFSWLVWPFGKIVLLVLLPLLLFVFLLMFMPVKMSPAVRLVTSIGVFGAFLVLRKVLASSSFVRGLLTSLVGVGPPVPSLETASLVIALIWLAGQMVLVVVTDRFRSGIAGAVESFLAERGFAALIRSVARGEFGATSALWISGLRWGILILVGCLLLTRSGSLDQLEENVVLPLSRLSAVPGASASMVVTLTTPDNNARQFLETALELNARFREGGAAVVCFPARVMRDSTTRSLADSLIASGAVLFDRGQFDPRYAMVGHSWNFLRFRSIDFSWSHSTPVVHPSLLAAARYLKLPVRVPPSMSSSFILMPGRQGWSARHGGGRDRIVASAEVGQRHVRRAQALGLPPSAVFDRGRHDVEFVHLPGNYRTPPMGWADPVQGIWFRQNAHCASGFGVELRGWPHGVHSMGEHERCRLS
ncbi:MAG: hypothetical protein IPI01_21415 [Ignavibacteriae bacterium]|nr:hypothetical protein [Ignavibacteriota bacterium]